VRLNYILNVLIPSGGVTTVWHLVEVAKRYFGDKVCIHLCDINDRSLIPAATIADRFYRVPVLGSEYYYKKMIDLMKEEHIDVIVPLIDQDLFTWNRDNSDLIALGIRSTGPRLKSVQTLSNKRMLTGFLANLGLETPKIVQRNEMMPNQEYIIKSEIGCGSQGVFSMWGGEGNPIPDDAIIQEKCDGAGYEVTAEVFNTDNKFAVFCRHRIAVKSGVCTKMEPVNIPEIRKYIKRVVQNIECPVAFCAQFIQHKGKWCLIDCNLRLGAGTAMSSAAGFQLVRAFWADICGDSVSDEWLEPKPNIKKVLRVYKEIVIQ